MKIPMLIRCVVPGCAGILFLSAGLAGLNAVGLHLLPFGFVVIGASALLIGAYYGIWRLKFSEGGFIAYPGGRRFRIDEVTDWSLGGNAEAEQGHRRHLELKFDAWWRRYILCEEDVSAPVFDEILRSLREKKTV